MDRNLPAMQDAPEVILDLSGWPPERQIEAGRDVEALMKHPGWNALCDGIGQLSVSELLLLRDRPPLQTTADYADRLGFVRGLSRLESVAKRIVEVGKDTVAERQKVGAA